MMLWNGSEIAFRKSANNYISLSLSLSLSGAQFALLPWFVFGCLILVDCLVFNCSPTFFSPLPLKPKLSRENAQSRFVTNRLSAIAINAIAVTCIHAPLMTIEFNPLHGQLSFVPFHLFHFWFISVKFVLLFQCCFYLFQCIYVGDMIEIFG